MTESDAFKLSGQAVLEVQPSFADVSVVIPTYERDEILIQTLHSLCSCVPAPKEILVMDQTLRHNASTEAQLQQLQESKAIRWFRLPTPSITQAMNRGLQDAESPLVLFVDDDIIADSGLIAGHISAFTQTDIYAVAGQVIQPGQKPAAVAGRSSRAGLSADLDFPFYSTQPGDVQNVMAGNLSVRRQKALEVGGFNENFRGAAYRFETEFARRVIRAGGRIRFCPEASVQHLRADRGGTRIQGNHLASANPIHGVGDYYFAMLHGWTPETIGYMARRMIREVATKFHLRRPWYIPVKLFGELRAFVWAWHLKRQGPALLNAEAVVQSDSENSSRTRPVATEARCPTA